MPSPHLPPLGLYSPWDNRFPRRVDIDGTRRLYDTQVVVLSQHQNWVDPRHLKTLAWMIVGLIHALAPYPHATHRYAADAIVDGLRFLCLCLRPSPALTAENLFLRKQLALYRERHVKPTRATHTTRIANELLFMLGLRLSPRTVRKSLPRCRDCCPKPGMSSQRWRTLVRNHAQVIVACDFCVAVTATLRNLYLFVVTEHATRTILHANVTGHPTAVWTLQQLRAAIPAEHACRYLIHNRDSMFSQQFDQRGRHLGLRVLKTPMRSPQTNALCERLLGTLRRECPDLLVPLTEPHLRCLLHEWVAHYNEGRPHMSLGPGIPQPPRHLVAPLQAPRHQLPEHLRVMVRPILGDLHHEYQIGQKAA